MARPGSAKDWIKKTKEKIKTREKNKKLKYRYGITIDDYAEMLASQNGVCAICEYAPSSLEKVLAVDHCHTTMQIRGLLCQMCNRGIGCLKDDVKIVAKAIIYLTSKSEYGIIPKRG